MKRLNKMFVNNWLFFKKQLINFGEVNFLTGKEEWLNHGGTCRGTLGQVHKSGWLISRGCERVGQPVTDEEMANAKDFCIFVDCYMEH